MSEEQRPAAPAERVESVAPAAPAAPAAHAAPAAPAAPVEPELIFRPPDSPFGPVILPPVPGPDADRDAQRVFASMPQASGVRFDSVLRGGGPKGSPVKALLEAQGLRKRFGSREVVSGVDLEVGPGEIVGLLGRNGAGKTTTFRMIVGLLHPDSGRVRFDGRDITRQPMYARANRGLGYLAQEPSVFQRLNVEDNLTAVLELQEPDPQKRRDKLEELIAKLGLEDVRKNEAVRLSGGERRRLEIARAMTLKPRVVLFDEPFSGIDPIAVTEIQDILRKLKADGVGVLLTDHNVRETFNITDRTYIMDEGRIWIWGSPRDIVNNPEARQRYLGQGFRLDF